MLVTSIFSFFQRDFINHRLQGLYLIYVWNTNLSSQVKMTSKLGIQLGSNITECSVQGP